MLTRKLINVAKKKKCLYIQNVGEASKFKFSN